VSRPSIFITGAAAGIGRATAELFAQRGWFVGLYDIDEAGARALAAKLGPGNSCAARLDVADYAAFERALAQFWQSANQRLDLLFNNAGIGSAGDFEALSMEHHRAIIGVNFQGVVNGCHAAFQYLSKTPGARVISMSSASAIYGAPGLASYAATKFAVKGLTEALDIEWRRYGIMVRDILPLFVDTAMVTRFESQLKAKEVLGMHLVPADIANVVWRAAHWKLWPRVHWYPGAQGWLLALTQKLTPHWLNRFTTRRVSGY
jgi:NAD(P)-dependent dehydrogenase (short-subunit alcohol dehydrogenase family)